MVEVIIMSKSNESSNYLVDIISDLKNRRIRTLRLASQLTFFVLLNGVIIGLSRIPFPVPFSFPTGSPFGTVFGGLDAIQYILTSGAFPFLAFGVFFLTGATVGKFMCGWICPVGFWQDILTGISSLFQISKFKMSQPDNQAGRQLGQFLLIVVLFWSILVGTQVSSDQILVEELFTRMPYNVIEPFGILMVTFYYAISWDLFLSGPSVLAELNELGWLFFIKLVILLVISAVSLKIPRAYCRWVCPTGALLSPMSKHSILTVKRNPVKCVDGCTKCEAACPMQVPILDEPASGIANELCINCGNCVDACPDAMSFGFRL